MSDEPQLRLGLSAVLFLIAYLCVSMSWRRWQVWRQQLADQLCDWEFRRCWKPQTIDTSRIAPKVQQIRRDPAAAVRHRPWHAGYRQQLMASTRETILNLAYFQLAKGGAPGKTEGEAQNHAT